MRRICVLALVIGIGATGMVAAAFQQQPGAAQSRAVDVEKLKDNLFVLRGGGGNTAVFVQAKGVTVVDTKNPGWGQPILDKIRELTDKPVTTIINTHTHGDHVSGNVEFPVTVEIVTHENTKTNMERMAKGIPKPSVFTTSEGRGLPKRTFSDRLTLGTGPDQVDLYYFGPAHTNGDAMVVFPALRVMHMGDVFPGKQVPFMDVNNGGSPLAYADTLQKTHDGVKNVESIITGHSTVMTPKDLLDYAGFMRELVDAVRAGKKRGQTAAQIAESWKPSGKYPGYPAPEAGQVEVVFKEIQ